MKALIIYDTISPAFKAINSLRNADSSADAPTPLKIKLWRLGLMRFPSMAGEALREASDADLILFAVRRTQALPSWMKHWLERWAMHRVAPVSLRSGKNRAPAGFRRFDVAGRVTSASQPQPTAAMACS
jgi:hypothetical protein